MIDVEVATLLRRTLTVREESDTRGNLIMWSVRGIMDGVAITTIASSTKREIELLGLAEPIRLTDAKDDVVKSMMEAMCKTPT